VKPFGRDVQALYPWTGNKIAVDGGALHYLDEGPSDGLTLLCLHGNPTWSFYWREIVKQFSDRHRVVVPDHIGCGLSDKPQNWGYKLADHVANIERLVEHLDLRDIVLVVHDWGGTIGMGLATRHPERIKAIVVTNTAAFRSHEIPPSIAACRIPVLGPLAVRGFNGFAWTASWKAVAKKLPRDVKDGLLHPYDSWANRIATLKFVEDIPLKPSHPSYSTLLDIEQKLCELTDRPMIILWGDDDFCFTPTFREEWQRRFPKAQVEAWEDVGHYVMEDAPKRVVGAVQTFLEGLE
jgi:haloalkane dehalogenase